MRRHLLTVIEGDHGGMELRAGQEGCSGRGRQMGAADGSQGEADLRPADENQMGELQSPSPDYTPQHRLGQEAPGVPRIHRGSRDGPPAGAPHNARFIALMDQFMPKWQSCRQNLNRLPVRHESWGY